MQINPNNLITVANYAKSRDCTPTYIYKLIRDGKLNTINVDNVIFIDKTNPIKIK